MDGFGLTGESGFIDRELGVTHESEIRRHLVAGLQQHQVTGDEFLGGHDPVPAVAHHLGIGADHRAQALQCRLGTGFLDEADDRVDQHHGEDHRGVDELTQSRGDHAGHQEHVDQRMMELPQNSDQQARTADRGQCVGAERLEPIGGLVVGQPALRVAAQQQHHLVGGKPVVRGGGGAGGHQRRIDPVNSNSMGFGAEMRSP